MFIWMVLGVIVIASALVSPVTFNVYKKTAWYLWGLKYMLTSGDLKKPKTTTEVFQTPVPGGKQRTLRVVFVRHGQSVWNSLFNKFGVMWPVRVVTAIVKETTYFFTDPHHSLIIDSPLSAAGKKEAEGLAEFVRRNRDGGLFPTDPTKSSIVSSNLRRALETAAKGLAPRIATTREKIVMDSALQEGTRNIDGHSFSTEPGKIAPTPINGFNQAVQHAAHFDPSFNEGNKGSGNNVHVRIDAFVRHLFGLPGSHGGIHASEYIPASPGKGVANRDLEEIIVVGHSGYFKAFFQRFLPHDSKHVAKKKKMKNCAMVAFNLTFDEATGRVAIDEKSMKELYLGFQK